MQPDHIELMRLLKEMMEAQQYFLANRGAVSSQPISAVEAAALHASDVLRNEWKTVKLGENAYRDAVRTTSYTL